MMSMMKSVTIINFWMLFYIYIDIFGFQSVFTIQVQFLICLEFTLNFLDCAKYALVYIFSTYPGTQEQVKLPTVSWKIFI